MVEMPDIIQLLVIEASENSAIFFEVWDNVKFG